jgi:hypothetical protein
MHYVGIDFLEVKTGGAKLTPFFNVTAKKF